MKAVTLKSMKRYPSLSEETEAFSAVIYLDGRKAGDVRNDGQGGCNYYHFATATDRADFDAAVAAWAVDAKETFEPDDAFINFLMTRESEAKFIAKCAKKGLPVVVKLYTHPLVDDDDAVIDYCETVMVGLRDETLVDAVVRKYQAGKHEVLAR